MLGRQRGLQGEWRASGTRRCDQEVGTTGGFWGLGELDRIKGLQVLWGGLWGHQVLFLAPQLPW